MGYMITTKIRTFLHRKTYKMADVFISKYRNEEWDKEVERAYKKLMKAVLHRWFYVFGKLDNAINNVCWGNWARLHLMDSEKFLSVEDYKKKLFDEIEYCSDRWSWDRFLRVNWLYQRITEKLEEKRLGF